MSKNIAYVNNLIFTVYMSKMKDIFFYIIGTLLFNNNKNMDGAKITNKTKKVTETMEKY